MNLFNLRISIDYDGWFRPYAIFRRLDNGSAKYYGHRWYLLFHLLWWEVAIYEAY